MQVGDDTLAKSIVLKGQMALMRGDLKEGVNCFEKAHKLDSTNTHLLYMQGLFLFEYGNKRGDAKGFSHAHKKFKAATLLAPNHFESWQALARVLYALGMRDKKQYYFDEAQKALSHALTLVDRDASDVAAELYRELGRTYMQLAQLSGEALDLHLSLDAFQKAQALHGDFEADFWLDFSRVCYQFACHVNDIRFYTKAILCIKQAIALDPTAFTHFQLLGEIFHALYFHTHNEDHFTQANDAFSMAASLKAEDGALWLQWAHFLCISSRKISDLKRLRSCIEKCQRASTYLPDNIHVQAIWAEALARLGRETEQLDLIHEAENKVNRFLENEEETPELWYAYGVIMEELGKYFNEDDHYYEAIEKFQEGLSIDRTCHTHWHAIGNLYALLGEKEHSPQTLELSLRFFHKAISLNPSTFYIIDHATALAKLGEMSHEQKWLEEAIVQFERALNSQKNAIYSHPDWLFHYAATLDALGDFHEEDTYYLRAIDLFSHVLMIDPDFPNVHHRLALTLSHLGELTRETDPLYRAIHHLRLSSKQDEENDAVILDFATILINLASHFSETAEAAQLYADAENKLWSAIRLGNPLGYYHLACLYSLLGHTEKGMHCLLKAAKSDVIPSIDEMLQDEWLDNLRATGSFIQFISQIEQRGKPRES